jgi:hypothetical protein
MTLDAGQLSLLTGVVVVASVVRHACLHRVWRVGKPMSPRNTCPIAGEASEMSVAK